MNGSYSVFIFHSYKSHLYHSAVFHFPLDLSSSSTFHWVHRLHPSSPFVHFSKPLSKEKKYSFRSSPAEKLERADRVTHPYGNEHNQ